MNARLFQLLRRAAAGLSARERLFLVLFLWAGLVLWAGALLGAFRRTAAQLTLTATAAATQDVYLNGRQSIEQRLAEATVRLKPEETLGASELVARLEELAHGVRGGRFEIAPTETDASDIGRVHTTSITFRNTSIETVVAYEAALRAAQPYLGLEQIRLGANRTDPRQLDAEFAVASFELAEDLN